MDLVFLKEWMLFRNLNGRKKAKILRGYLRIKVS